MEGGGEQRSRNLRSWVISASRYFKKKRVRKRKVGEFGGVVEIKDGGKEEGVVFEEVELKKRFFN